MTGNKGKGKEKKKEQGEGKIVSLAAVFSIVTQRSSPQRDDTKNGCKGD